MRVFVGLALIVVLLLAGSAASAATAPECGPEFLRLDDTPEWAPDGSRIAFIRRRIFVCATTVDAFDSLETVRPDGSDQRTLVTGSSLRLAWAPGSNWLAVTDGSSLRVIDAEDGRVSHSIPFSIQYSQPVWSPDATQIAFGTTIVDVATGLVRDLHVSTGPPSWSPDSRWITYLGPFGLEIAAADGSRRQWIGPGGVSGGSAHWSPDGEWIAYQTSNELRFVHPDGSSLREFPDYGSLLGWTPDSDRVLVFDPRDSQLHTVARDGAATRIGSVRHRFASLSWRAMSAASVGVDLCRRPGIFVENLEQARARRVTNDCVIRGSRRGDNMVGTSLPDTILGLGGNDTVLGGGGDDVLSGGAGRDRVLGGTGDDTANGGPGDDVVAGEIVTGGPGRDTLIAGSDPQRPATAVYARDGERDVIRCPSARWNVTRIFADKIDRVSPLCFAD